MNAVCDLANIPANFNFLEFLLCAATHGADHIVLDESGGYKKFKGDALKERMTSIIEPSCALAGCGFSYSSKGKCEGPRFGYHVSLLLKTYADFGKIVKLSSVLPAGSEEFTVTLRSYERHPERNSGGDWRKFAKDIGAMLIEDYSVGKMPLHKRMALYAGARMNYFVVNGPCSLALFSDYPYTVFMKNINVDYHLRHGWYRTQLPWARGPQKCVWDKEDTYANLMEEFECCVAS